MATNYNPRIVTDGLVLALDAGNPKSYPGSGNTWYDLSGNGKNGTLEGAGYNSANGGSLTFDGTNDIAFFPATNSIIGNSQSIISHILIFKTTDTTNRMYASSLKRSTGASTLLSIAVNSDIGNFASGYIGFLTSDGASHSWITYNGSVNDGNWHFLGCVVDTNGRRLYLDGNLVASDATLLTTATGNTGTYTIGGFDTANLLFGGSIGLSLIYTKSLNTQEIQQNFNATRSRFGI